MKKVYSLVLFLAFLLMLAACSSGTNTPAQPATNDAKPVEDKKDTKETPATKEAKVVNIGFSGPLSGPAAFYGENTLSGVTMAADEINETGFEVNGETYKLNVVKLDDKYLPNETGTNARRLVQENKTPIIFVPHSGGIFATQVFNEQENFIISAYTSEPKVQEVGNQLTLSIPPAYSAYPVPFSKYQMKRFGNKLAVLPTASQYGKDWTETLVPVWEELGGEVVYEGSIDFSKDTDFFTIVTNALSKDPDVLFVGGPSQPTALVIKQARELGFKGGFIIMDQAKFEEMEPVLGGYDMLEGAVGTLPIYTSDAPGGQVFKAKYEEEFGRIPTAEGAFNYQTLHVLVKAMQAAGTVSDPKKIMENIQAGIDSLEDDQMVWHLSGLDNGRFNWKPSATAIENGEFVIINE